MVRSLVFPALVFKIALSFRPQEARNSETFFISSANPGYLLNYSEIGMVVLPAAPSGGPLASIVREAVRTTATYTVALSLLRAP